MKRPALIWALLLYIGLVNGAMAVPSVGHVEHHAHHQADTHSTGICAWQCVAGQDIEFSSVEPTSTRRLIERVFLLPCQIIFSAVSFDFFFRGPPAFLR